MKKLLFVYLTLIFIGVSCDQAPSSTTIYDPVQKWGEEKVAWAKKIMTLANEDCQIYEEDGSLVVEMQMYIKDRNILIEYVQAIANSDVILHGQVRTINFYDPSYKQIAQSYRLNVELIE